MALAIGVLPFLFSWLLQIPGHQLVSALALTFACLYFAGKNRYIPAIVTIAVAYLAHCLVVIGVAVEDANGVSSVLPGAADYWLKQMSWLSTGWDPEYDPWNWIWAHIQLLFGVVVYSYLSFGAITFYEGFIEVDLMNFYNAQLLAKSKSLAVALSLGWHPWSLLRGIGFTFITYEVLSVSFRRTVGGVQGSSGYSWGWLIGLSFLLADGLIKLTTINLVRDHLFLNLQP